MAKITFRNWYQKHGLTKENAVNLLYRRILKDKGLKERVEKRRVYMEQWFVDETLRPIKTAEGKWEII
jgi:hypothetical protein